MAELVRAVAMTVFALLGVMLAPLIAAANPGQKAASGSTDAPSKKRTAGVPVPAPPVPMAVPSMAPQRMLPSGPPVAIAPPAPPQSPPPFPVSVEVAGEPLNDPRTWFTDTDYPAEAKRNNQQGRVTIGLYVDPQGRPERCIVITRSGSSSLDQTSCRLAMMRARFKPAVTRDGAPTGFIYTTSMLWHLADDLDFDLGTKMPDVSKGPILKTLIRTVVDVDADGRGVACHSGTAAVSDDEACADFYPGRRMIDPVTRAGKAVPATITLTRSVRVDPKVTATVRSPARSAR
ncbi:MAG: energy transducer TonB [Sphingomonas sp.]|uniref:energy transducer TonB n=1 Tax=Sphingomonas sp. TaxID=28214 RepID=UPI003F8227A7